MAEMNTEKWHIISSNSEGMCIFDILIEKTFENKNDMIVCFLVVYFWAESN